MLSRAQYIYENTAEDISELFSADIHQQLWSDEQGRSVLFKMSDHYLRGLREEDIKNCVEGDEYNLNQIEKNLDHAIITHEIEKSDLLPNEKKMVIGVYHLINCPDFVSTLDMTELERLKSLMPGIKLHKSVHESLLSLPWKSTRTDNGKSRDSCGSCYRWILHSCEGEKCPVCPGTGTRMVTCKVCSKIPHKCTLCKSGYVLDGDKRRICPNIKKMPECALCKTCKGYPDETPKKCKGACPYLHHTTLKIDKSGKKMLTVGCACGRPHQIGDCPGRWRHKKTGNISKSPYQQWKKCPSCYWYHPVILSFTHLSEYELITTVFKPTDTIRVDGKDMPAIKNRNGEYVPAINIHGKWRANNRATQTESGGWTLKRKRQIKHLK